MTFCSWFWKILIWYTGFDTSETNKLSKVSIVQLWYLIYIYWKPLNNLPYQNLSKISDYTVQVTDCFTQIRKIGFHFWLMMWSALLCNHSFHFLIAFQHKCRLSSRIKCTTAQLSNLRRDFRAKIPRQTIIWDRTLNNVKPIYSYFNTYPCMSLHLSDSTSDKHLTLW